MTQINLTNSQASLLKNERVPTNSEQIVAKSNLVRIKGILTSNLRSRKSSNTPYMAFLRLDNSKHSLVECQEQKCQDCDIPIAFRIRGEMEEWLEPMIKKDDRLELKGNFASSKANRPSFTCYSYQIIND